MTIETTSPAGAESLAALFDQLVEAVAQRVKVHLTGPVFEAHVYQALQNLNIDSRINACIDDWADNHLDDRLDAWATVHLDIEGDIDRYMRNELDIEDAVKDCIRDLTFEVTVS